MTSAPRDIDIKEWLNGIRYHAPSGDTTRQAHEALRHLVAAFGVIFNEILPPGRDKSIVFTLLEDMLMRANRAVAVNDGPAEGMTAELLAEVVADSPIDLNNLDQLDVDSIEVLRPFATEGADFQPPRGDQTAVELHDSNGRALAVSHRAGRVLLSIVEPGLGHTAFPLHEAGPVEDLAAALLAARNASFDAGR